MPFVSRWSSRTVRVLTALLLTVRSAAAQTSPAQASTAKIVSAASAFLATLDEKQRSGMLFAFDDEKQRVRWSNFPTGFVPRSGVRFADMNPSQRAAAMSLLATALSKRGLEKVQQIVDADEVLRVSERNNPMFGKENDKAFALMGSLDEGQRSQAILGYRVSDLVLGPGKDGKTIQPEGLRASAMNDAQRSMLFDLITEWTGIVHESAAKERLAREFRAAEKCLVEGLDLLVDQFEEDHPEFVAEFKNARVVVEGPTASKPVVELAQPEIKVTSKAA